MCNLENFSHSTLLPYIFARNKGSDKWSIKCFLTKCTLKVGTQMWWYSSSHSFSLKFSYNFIINLDTSIKHYLAKLSWLTLLHQKKKVSKSIDEEEKWVKLKSCFPIYLSQKRGKNGCLFCYQNHKSFEDDVLSSIHRADQYRKKIYSPTYQT